MLVEPSTQGDGGTLFVPQATRPGRPARPAPGQARADRRRAGLALRQGRAQDPPQIVIAMEHYNRLVRMSSRARSSRWPSTSRSSSTTTT